MSGRVLVISAHADDETLGCGGTLLKHRAVGDKIDWLVVTAPWKPMFDDAFLVRRKEQVAAVSKAYGMARVTELGLPAARLDTVPLQAVIADLKEALGETTFDTVYMVHHGDVHSDHRVVYEAAVAVLKPFAGGGAREILSYETASSTNLAPPTVERCFLPHVYCDITAFIDAKLDILSLYEGEIADAPHPRSLEAVRALARYRGSTVSVDYAEAFMMVRKVW